MPSELAPLISAMVALSIAATSSFLTWTQVRRERRKWLVDTKLSLSMEIYRTRLASYPSAFRVLGGLSHAASPPLISEHAGVVAAELNDWLYSTGGMCASATTRGAVLGLRQACSLWNEKGGEPPPELYEFRNLALAFLRRDLDLEGLESYEFSDSSTWLTRLQDDLHRLESRRPHVSNDRRLSAAAHR